MGQPSVAVLGGGIMGSSVALHLARMGAHATVLEREAKPFMGASRWNEGKIHLGFLYAADPTLRTRALGPRRRTGLRPAGRAADRSRLHGSG